MKGTDFGGKRIGQIVTLDKLRAEDRNEDMLCRLREMHIEDLETPGDAYLGYGQHNPFLNNTRLELSKELEIINFRVLQENQLDDRAKKGNSKHWISDDSKSDNDGKNKIKDQLKSFQKAMRAVIVWGQYIGLNPVTGILQKDVSKMRFTKCSLKFLFALNMAIVQIIGTMLCFYRLYKNPNNIGALAFFTFFTTACCTTISFIRVAPRWPALMKQLINSRLDEYIHPNIVKRCNVACGVFLGMAFMEHIMSTISRISRILECSGGEADVGEVFVKVTSPWLYELNVPYVEWLAIIVQYLNLVTTATWNYADIFIVCMSLYLTSILEQINKKIALTASKNYVPATTWGALREDYTRATNLVKLFDNVFSSIVLVTFANDLFFICLQIYNVLAVFRTYMYPAYLMYSTVYLCVRFLTVALVASGVNTSSLLPLPVLYTVPPTSYNKEVERFQNQINGEIVALSGLHFFYITRDMVLTVAGTIVTYELVLLQLDDDDK